MDIVDEAYVGPPGGSHVGDGVLAVLVNGVYRVNKIVESDIKLCDVGLSYLEGVSDVGCDSELGLTDLFVSLVLLDVQVGVAVLVLEGLSAATCRSKRCSRTVLIGDVGGSVSIAVHRSNHCSRRLKLIGSAVDSISECRNGKGDEAARGKYLAVLVSPTDERTVRGVSIRAEIIGDRTLDRGRIHIVEGIVADRGISLEECACNSLTVLGIRNTEDLIGHLLCGGGARKVDQVGIKRELVIHLCRILCGSICRNVCREDLLYRIGNNAGLSGAVLVGNGVFSDNSSAIALRIGEGVIVFSIVSLAHAHVSDDRKNVDGCTEIGNSNAAAGEYVALLTVNLHLGLGELSALSGLVEIPCGLLTVCLGIVIPEQQTEHSVGLCEVLLISAYRIDHLVLLSEI